LPTALWPGCSFKRTDEIEPGRLSRNRADWVGNEGAPPS
jgi:hypothetical protein